MIEIRAINQRLLFVKVYKKVIVLVISVVVLGVAGLFYLNSLLNKYRKEADHAMIWSGEYAVAIENYSKLIYWNRDKPGLYYLRGDAYTGKGEHSKAIADYETALSLGISDTLQTILRISLAAIQMGDLDLAEENLIKLAILSSNSENEYWAANYHLGQLEYRKGNYRGAINYYNKSRLVMPNYRELYHRANAYYALGKIDSAIQDYNASIEFVKRDYLRLNPNSSLSKCDTCGFPFGSPEYELLTNKKGWQTMTDLLEKLEFIFTLSKPPHEPHLHSKPRFPFI